jgi:transcriptional regulator with XRE-family HTH domain
MFVLPGGSKIDILRLARASCATMKKRGLKAFYQAFGNLVRLRRQQRPKPLRQEELGRLVGLSRTSIINVEKGRHRLVIHQLLAFSRALNVPPEALLPGARSTKYQRRRVRKDRPRKRSV